jgi:hypothetical protein
MTIGGAKMLMFRPPWRDRQLEDALAECDRLRDRVAELERLLAAG